MALDARYVLAYHFEQYFVDKDTGAPLEGTVTFFQDIARTVPKNVYKLSGSPPNYTYVSLGNEVDIANGVPTDADGNNIAIYFFPYLGDPVDESTTIDLYYYETKNSGGVLQFTREAQPNVFGGSTGTAVEENFVPNGQFKLHNDLPVDGTFTAGEIREDITDIAPGGWTFERPASGSSDDFVTFEQHLPTTPDIAANPRYSVKIETDGTPSRARSLRLRYNDVNKFASIIQEYTFGFTVKSFGGALSNVGLYLHKDYGTGGSMATDTFIATLNPIPLTQTKYAFSFTFGDNSAKTIGTANDDFLQLYLLFPNSSLEVEFTDFYLATGDLINENPDFSQTPDSEFIYKSLAGFIPRPQYDGADLYLPILLTKAGFTFDYSLTGKIFSTAYEVGQAGEAVCDGTGQEYASYTTEGIPKKRLGDVLWDAARLSFKFGTPLDFMTSYLVSTASNNNIAVTNNTLGNVTNAADVNTGFTISNIHKGSPYYVNGLWVNGDTLYIINNEFGAVNKWAAAGTSGFTVTTLRYGKFLPDGGAGNPSVNNIRHLTQVITTGAAGLAGDYFTFTSLNSGVNTDFYVWFKVNGSGSDPAPGGTGIEVDLLSTYTSQQVAQLISQAVSGFQITSIITIAASGITTGDYFTINSTGDDYYVWYNKDSGGGDPAPGGKIGIEVDISSADTAAQVATETIIAINKKYYALPDLRGVFIRGWNNSSGIDPDAAMRWSPSMLRPGDLIGTFQLDEILSHAHKIYGFDGLNETIQTAETHTPLTKDHETSTVDFYGGHESRPLNVYLNYIIKY